MKKFLSSKFLFVLLFCLLTNSFFLFAQDSVSAFEASTILTDYDKSDMSIFDDLEDEPQLKIKLESNFSNLIENKNEDKYQPAVMTYTTSEGEIFQKALRIKARGRFRKKICDFPPLKLKFDKEDLVEEGYAPKYKSLKLVTHCLDSEQERQNVIKEYLAYKMYNQLTPQSFEVKLVEVTYIDPSRDEDPIVRFGFIIENTKEMSDRLRGDEIEEYNMGLSVMDDRDRHVFSMFQFMIGNTDWKTNMMHNIKIVKSDDGKEITMVPYDFDFAGIVNTSYARPNPDYKQVSVTQRVYMDKVKSLDELNEIIRFFKKHKKSMFDMVENMTELDKKNKKEVIQYLKSFYNILGNSNQSKMAFVSESL